MHYTLNNLLEEINRVAKVPNAADLELFGIRAARDVFREIGTKITCDLYNKVFTVKQGYIPFPREVVAVVDVGPVDTTQGQGHKLEVGMTMKEKYAYYATPLGIRFSNIKNEQVRLYYYSFFIDEEGELLIPEVTLEACKLRGQYYALEGKYDHPEYPNRENLRFKSNQECTVARGTINESSVADQRTRRRLLI